MHLFRSMPRQKLNLSIGSSTILIFSFITSNRKILQLGDEPRPAKTQIQLDNNLANVPQLPFSARNWQFTFLPPKTVHHLTKISTGIWNTLCGKFRNHHSQSLRHLAVNVGNLILYHSTQCLSQRLRYFVQWLLAS